MLSRLGSTAVTFGNWLLRRKPADVTVTAPAPATPSPASPVQSASLPPEPEASSEEDSSIEEGPAEPAPATDPTIPTVDASPDALGYFLKALETDLARDVAQVNWWMTKKVEVISATGKEDESVLVKAERKMSKLIKEKIQEVKNLIMGSVKLGDVVISNLIESARPTLNEAHLHMDALCKALHQHSKEIGTSPEARKIEVSICDVSIEMNNEMIDLHNAIIEEIHFCLNAEAHLEEAARVFAVFLVAFFFHAPLPELGFSFTERYRAYFQNRNEENEVKLDKFVSSIEGCLKHAKKVLENFQRSHLKGNKSVTFQPAPSAPAPSTLLARDSAAAPAYTS